MKYQLPLLVLLLLGISFHQANAQEGKVKTTFFKQRPFGKYFISDYYAPIVNLSSGFALNNDEYNINLSRDQNYLFLTEPLLGAEIPIYLRQGEKSSFALSFPISFYTILDILEERTAPILNTDYRVGGFEMNYLHHLSQGPIKNFGIKLIPIFHESTHLGDEITIMRRRDSFPTARINPSYESFELAFLVNDAHSKVERNHSLKLGSRFLFKPKKGWYVVSASEADSASILPSKRGFEPYLQYQFQDPIGFLASKDVMLVVSLEARLRVRYGYPIYERNPAGGLIEIPNEEAFQPSFNLLAGWRFTNQNELRRLGIYFRAYSGVNPHGQFRNLPKYQFFGFSFVYEN